jgi:hypothetical protein
MTDVQDIETTVGKHDPFSVLPDAFQRFEKVFPFYYFG